MKFKKLVALLTSAVITMGCLGGCGGKTEAVSPESEPSSQSGSSEEAGEVSSTEESNVDAGTETEDVTIWYYWETEGHQVALEPLLMRWIQREGFVLLVLQKI